MSHHIVELINLSHSYSDGTLALKNINIRITHGQSVGIIGANGAGKSTLLQHLNGCLRPTAGEIRIGEIPINEVNLNSIRRDVGLVFQDSDDQLFMPTVFDDVSFGLFNLGVPKKEIEKYVEVALEKVGAWHLRNKAPYHLSGGEKKRVAIATVLAMNPSVLVLDEPTNGLDSYSRRQMIQLMTGFGHTKIIATHDLDLVLSVCQRVIVLKSGEVAADDLPLQIFNNEKLLSECRMEKPLSMTHNRDSYFDMENYLKNEKGFGNKTPV